jgi:ribosomal protein S18 acetylase RimI-like enzyme
MDVTYREIGPAEFRTAISALVAVYAAAMNPPDRMLAGRDAIMERHAGNPGFRCIVGYDQGLIAGFIYGFHGMPGQWWHDMVATALAMRSASNGATGDVSRGGVANGSAAGARASGASASGQSATDIGPGWLDDSFEIAELHVLPGYQGHGVGRRLLLSLAAQRPERTAVLSTADAPTRARRLYRGVGFTDLLTGFRFAGGEPPYAVMGARLPLTADRSAKPSSW